MMLKKSILLTTLFNLIFINVSAKTENNKQEIRIDITNIAQDKKQKTGWKHFIKKNAPAICLSSSIGILTGAICAGIENKKMFPWFFKYFNWLIFWGARNTAIHLLTQQMKESDVPHDRDLSFLIARLSDWAIYLLL